MVEFVAIGLGGFIGVVVVKTWEYFTESLQSKPELSYTEREELKRKQKEEKEAQEWANRAILSDEAFAVLKRKIDAFGKLKDANASYAHSLVQSVMDCGMRFSIQQIQELKPIVTHWCVYDGKPDKKRAEIHYVNMVKEGLTAKVEAKEAILNLLLEEKA